MQNVSGAKSYSQSITHSNRTADVHSVESSSTLTLRSTMSLRVLIQPVIECRCDICGRIIPTEVREPKTSIPVGHIPMGVSQHLGSVTYDIDAPTHGWYVTKLPDHIICEDCSRVYDQTKEDIENNYRGRLTNILTEVSARVLSKRTTGKP